MVGCTPDLFSLCHIAEGIGDYSDKGDGLGSFFVTSVLGRYLASSVVNVRS